VPSLTDMLVNPDDSGLNIDIACEFRQAAASQSMQ